jgi:hypothetical protein
MVRVVSVVVVVLAVCICLSPVVAGKQQPPAAVVEQNLDEQGNIKVHEQGTVNVQGAVTVNDLAGVLGKLQEVLTQLQQTLQVQGSVAVTNWPDMQQVAGTVNVGAMPAVQIAQPAGSPVPVTVSNPSSGNQVDVTGPTDGDGNIRVATHKPPQAVFLGTAVVPVASVYEFPPVEVKGAQRVTAWYRAEGEPSATHPDASVSVYWQIAPGASAPAFSPPYPSPSGYNGYAFDCCVGGRQDDFRTLEATPVGGPFMVLRITNKLLSPGPVTISAYAYITY